MIAILLALLLAVHLMCVNVGSAGPAVCIWLEWREWRGDQLAGRAGRYLAGLSIWLLIGGMALGVAMGFLLWSPEYRSAIVQLRSRVEFGVWELLFSLFLMGAQLFWWKRATASPFWQRAIRTFLLLLAATNLLYHFPILFVVISQVSAAGASVETTIDSAEFRTRMFHPEVLSRTAHFWLASAAMVGVMLIGFALRLSRQGAAEDDVHRAAVWGGRLALVPTLIQLPVGVWVLLALPEDIKLALMGGDLVGAALLGVSIMAALGLMHQLSSVAFGDTNRATLLRAMAMMVLVVVLMSATLERVRVIRKVSLSARRTPVTIARLQHR